MNEGEKRIESKKELLKDNFSEEGLRKLREVWYPAGSGPLSACAMVCALLDEVAKEKGWDISPMPSIKEVEKNGKLLTDYDAEGHDEDGVIGFCEIYEYKGKQYIITDWNKRAVAYGKEIGKTIIHK